MLPPDKCDWFWNFSNFSLQSRQPSPAWGPEFEEICIPERTKQVTADFAKLGGLLCPDQPMVNWICGEVAKAAGTVPGYQPYITGPLRKFPWAHANNSGHAKAMESFKNRQVLFKIRQPMSLQAWIAYKLRRVFAVELCGAWAAFGGLVAQMNNFGIVLCLAVIANANFALIYDSKLQNKLAGLARSRAVDVDFDELLSTENQEIKRLAQRELRTDEPKRDHKGPVKGGGDRPKGKGKEGTGKGKKRPRFDSFQKRGEFPPHINERPAFTDETGEPRNT